MVVGLMGVDRTGKPSSPAPSPGTDATPAASAESPLGRLRAGDISLEVYLDLKVDEATLHLAAMPSAQLESVRALLRKKLAEEPELRELVRRATQEGSGRD
jgi:hypothetical protein